MDKQIKSILKDLYELDPSLKNQEAELVKIIKTLIKQKPNAKLSQAYKKELEKKILTRIQELQSSQGNQAKAFVPNNMNFLNKFAYAAAGAVAIVLILVPVLLLQDKDKVAKQPETAPQSPLLSTNIEIEKTADSAFGQLSLAGQNAPDGRGAGAAEIGALEEPATAPGVGAGGYGGDGDKAASSGMIMPYEPYNFIYTYAGEEFSLPEPQMAVYKRLPPKTDDISLPASWQQADLGLIDLSELNAASLQHMNIKESGREGLIASLNFEQGQLSLYRQHYYDANQPPAAPLTESDMPDEQALIAIADAFVAKYQLDLSGYGDPIVNNDWQEYRIMGPENEGRDFVPEEIQVIYPLNINGRTVYNTNGRQHGVSVSVSVRDNRVNSVWGMSINRFQSSGYATVQNKNKIMQSLENGGYMNYVYKNEEAKEVEIKLGTPELKYVVTYNYTDGNSEELIIPALVFRVIEKPEVPYYHRDNITIPIINDLLEQDLNRPQPEILPAR